MFCRAAIVLIDLFCFVSVFWRHNHMWRQNLVSLTLVTWFSPEWWWTTHAPQLWWTHLLPFVTTQACNALHVLFLDIASEWGRKERLITNLSVPSCAAVCLSVGRLHFSFSLHLLVCDSPLSLDMFSFITHPQEDWVDRFLQINIVWDCK